MSKKQPQESRVDVAEEIEQLVRERKPRRRWPLFFVTLCTLLLVLVGFAPTIVSLTPLGPKLVASAAAGKLNGSLEVSSVSVGWFSPTQVRGVIVKDKDGATLATVDSIVVDRSLLNLISTTQQLGKITVVKPDLLLTVRPDGSNLEDLIAPLLAQPSSGAATPQCIVEVQEGRVKLVDSSSGQTWELVPIIAQFATPTSREPSYGALVDLKLGDRAVRLEAALANDSSVRMKLDSNRFPLEPLAPIAARVMQGLQLSGEVSGMVECEIAEGGKNQKLKLKEVDAKQIAVRAPTMLGADTLRVEQCVANGDAQFIGGIWQLRNLQIQSDVAALSGSGDIRTSDFAANSIPQSDCEIHGVIDLARLSRLLPGTLRVRQGVEIVSGQAKVSLVSRAAVDGRQFQGSLTTENLQATNEGQRVSLTEPVQLTATLTQTNGGWRIDQMEGRSSFLTADATGTPENGKVTLRGDLNKLAAELDQFVDLGSTRLAGQINGVVQWQIDPSSRISATSTLKLTRFEIASAGLMPWTEDDLALAIQAQGITARDGSYGVAAGRIELVSEADKLDVTLRSPVNAVTTNSPLPVDITLTGNLATWLPRLQSFVPLAGWKVSGPIQLTAAANVSAARIEVPIAKVRINELRVDGGAIHIYEPEVRGETRFAYDMSAGLLSTSNTTLQSSSVALLAEKLNVQTGNDAKITGSIAGRGDVGRLMSWIGDPAAAQTYRFAGEADAEANFTQQGSETKATLSGKILNLAYLTRTPQPVAGAGVPARPISANQGWETVWSEPNVSMVGDAGYDASKDVVSLNKMQATLGGTSVVATGTIAQLASRCQLDLVGETKYDLANWTPKAQTYLGPTFAMSGAGAKPFEVHGPLFGSVSGDSREAPLLPLALAGKAGLGWDAAEWMALQMGKGELTAELKSSTVIVQPTKIPLSQGFVNLSPVVALRGSNWLLTQDQTKLVDQVVITPDMCSTWIKYIAPQFADATQTRGTFSVDLDQAQVPVFDPVTCNVRGKFIVHSVSVGPGPMMMPLVAAADQVKAFVDGKIGLDGLASLAVGPPAATIPEAPAKQWVELPEQSVPVEVVDGRVHHEGLTMKVKDVIIRTSGSVGIADQSLQLTAEIPIQDKWIASKKELAFLKGQSIKIPVYGTVTNLKLDTRAIVDFARSQAFAAGSSALQGQINSGLEKGTGAVQQELIKGQNKVQGEIEKGKKKIEDELRGSLKGLFGK